MKFLGLRIDDHDSNITYTDGKTVKYCATERLFGIKHHGYDNIWQWSDVLDSWGVKLSDIDAIAMITDKICFAENENYRDLDLGLPCKTYAVDHHWAHVLSTWMLGDIPKVNYVFDGFGNNDRSHSLYLNGKLKSSHSVKKTGSIGVEMAYVGKTCGFTADEWGLDLAGKVMGLQSYGMNEPNYYNLMDQYSIEEIKQIWNYDSWIRKWDNEFDINWLRTVHEITGDKLVEYMTRTGDGPITYTGGVAQNSVFNGKLHESGIDVRIPPHANDCGLSLGGVEFLRQKFHEEPFDTTGFPFWQDDEAPEEPTDKTITEAAESLAQGKIVGWYQGHGEIGPRALGHRSILVNPRLPNAKNELNSKVKHREHFRPFGAAVLLEDTQKYFEFKGKSPYMNTCAYVHDEELLSVTHVDGSSRIQTVEGDDSFAKLLRKYKELTGDSVLLNTSLNMGGKPIASKMWEAKELFSKKGIEEMYIGNDKLSK